MTRSTVVAAVIGGAVVAMAFVLNPTPEQHRAKIKEVVAERSPLAGALGLGALTAFTSTYHPLGVASYTRANERTQSVGALGIVIVLDPAPAK